MLAGTACRSAGSNGREVVSALEVERQHRPQRDRVADEWNNGSTPASSLGRRLDHLVDAAEFEPMLAC